MGRSSIVVIGGPKGALVRVDAKPIGTLPHVAASDLRIGEHAIQVAAPGHRRYDGTAIVKDGETTRVVVTLEPDAPVLTGRPLRTAGWVTFAVGSAAVGTGAGLLGHRESVISGLGDVRGTEYDDRVTEQAPLYWSGGVLLGTGAALTATGITLLKVDAVRAKRSEAAVSWLPALVPGGAGIAGTF